VFVEQELCLGWHTWAHALGVSSKAGGYIISYLFYVLLAVFPFLFGGGS
jgi:hypothetical protein